MVQAALPDRPAYLLGESQDELERLMEQDRFVGELTGDVLRLGGLRPGMDVLDVGCGVGDVSFRVATIVGMAGTVLGIDRSETAIATANARARTLGLTNVRFCVRDLTELELDQPVDALVGRLVLMYFADPAVILRRLARCVKPGGAVIFQEMDMLGAISEPRCDLFETSVERIRETFVRLGADTRTGVRLGQIFEEAGLDSPQMRLGGRAERGPSSPIYQYVAQITQTLLPLMQRAGVASAAEIGIDTLADRLRAEATQRNATLLAPPFIGAWSRTNDGSPET